MKLNMVNMVITKSSVRRKSRSLRTIYNSLETAMRYMLLQIGDLVERRTHSHTDMDVESVFDTQEDTDKCMSEAEADMYIDIDIEMSMGTAPTDSYAPRIALQVDNDRDSDSECDEPERVWPFGSGYDSEGDD